MTKAEALELLKKPFLCCDLKCYSQSKENCERCEQAFDMAIEALEQPTVQTIQDSCITIHGISSKYLEDKHDGKIHVYTEKGCRTYHWFGDDEE